MKIKNLPGRQPMMKLVFNKAAQTPYMTAYQTKSRNSFNKLSSILQLT